MTQYLWKIIAAILLTCNLLNAQPLSQSDSEKASLLEQFKEVLPKLSGNDFKLPIALTSFEQGDQFKGEIIGVLEHDFETSRQIFTQPGDWCNILMMHLNTKSCTYEKGANPIIHLSSGRKPNKKPELIKKLSMKFSILEDRSDYLSVGLFSNDGPLGTRDYRIELKAMPLPRTLSDETSFNGTIVRLVFSYRMSWFSRKATTIYLATWAREKVGFTKIDNDKNSPVYIRGLQGIIERNTIRYYLAIKTRLDSVLTGQDLEQQFGKWFDATEQYPLQLHEVEKMEYLEAKRKGLENQRREQKKLDAM